MSELLSPVAAPASYQGDWPAYSPFVYPGQCHFALCLSRQEKYTVNYFHLSIHTTKADVLHLLCLEDLIISLNKIYFLK